MTKPVALGPSEPLRDSAALSPARHRVLQALLRMADGGGACCLTDLVGELGGHPNTTRQHLEVLTAAGLVEACPAPAEGRGRPARLYRPTASGRHTVQSDPVAEEYFGLASAFAAHLAKHAADPAAEARAVGRGWGGRLSSPDQRIVRLLGRLGFGPVVADRPAAGARAGRLVRLTTCPLLAAAREHPEVVCEVHLGLVQGALGLGDAEAAAEGVGLEPFAEPGACLLHLPDQLVDGESGDAVS